MLITRPLSLVLAIASGTLCATAEMTSQPPAIASRGNTAKSQEQADKKPSVTNQNRNLTDKTSTAPNLIFAPKIDVKTSNSPAHSEKDSSPDYLAYTLGIIGAIIATFTLLAIRRQANIMQGTLDQIKLDAANHATETTSQIQIANNAANAASDNAKAALNAGRAHIWMKTMAFKFTRGIDQILNGHAVSYEIWNSGSTPGIANRVHLEAFLNTENQWPHIPVYTAIDLGHSGLVAPGSGHDTQDIMFPALNVNTANLALSLNSIWQKQLVLILYGYVAYTDVFDPNVEHRSGFAYRMTFSDQSPDDIFRSI